MDIIRSSLYFIVCFVASVAGAICGIGGGVIVKPVLDLFGWDSVSTISFLSGCMVLTMSCYSVGRSMLAGEKTVNAKASVRSARGIEHMIREIIGIHIRAKHCRGMSNTFKRSLGIESHGIILGTCKCITV